MLFVGNRVAGFVCFVATLFAGAICALAQPPEARLRTALAQQDAWLGQDGNAQQWRTTLLNEELQSQLAKAGGADRTSLLKVLAKYSDTTPGLDSPPFVQARNALVAWLASLPAPNADQLPALAREAKGVFIPYTKADLAAARATVLTAVERLEARIAAAGPTAAGWREYLQIDALRQQLTQPQPDLAKLDAVYQRFASGFEGLQLIWFADTRRALRTYLTTSRAIGQVQIAKQYQTALDKLAEAIERHAKSPTPDTAQEINSLVAWLDQAGQAPWVVAAIRNRLSHPNLELSISKAMIESRLGGPVTNQSPVRDCILGTDVYGTGQTQGNVTIELVPSEDTAIIDALFQGTINTNTVGYNGPVTIYSLGATSLGARKRLVFSAEQFGSQPTAVSAVTSTTICDIQARMALIEKIARRKATQQKAEAESIAAQHAEQQFGQRMDQQVDEALGPANRDFQQKFRRLLTERGIFPELFRFASTTDQVRLIAKETGTAALAAPTTPPQAPRGSDVTLSLHESAINNLTAAALGGIVLDETRFEEIITQYFNLPKRIETSKDDETWAITFPERQPVSVAFTNNGFSITIRGQAFASEGRDYPAMNISAVYAIRKTDRGLRAVRQGGVEVFPPGFVPNSGQQLSGRQQVLRTAIGPRFERFLTEEIVPQNFVLKGEGSRAIELALTRWEAANGWLMMDWKVVPHAEAPTKVQTAATEK
jgi:hypothetical protein